MAEKLTEDDLLAAVEREESNCLVHFTGKLSDQRAKALSYYYAEPYGDEVEGRSQVVTSEVKDAVEGILPPLMAIFTAGDEIVRFEPQQPEDEEAAQQATDTINYIFSRANNGFLALYCMFKDALLQKNGYVKVYWEEYEDVEKETYENLSDVEFQSLMMGGELELLEHSERPDVEAQKMMQAVAAQAQMQGQVIPELPMPMLHDAKFKKTKKYGKVCVDPIPPEEVLISRDATNDIKKARFVEHRTLRTISEIREMGYDIDDDIEDSSSNAEFNQERVQRLSFDDATGFKDEEEGADKSTRRVWLCEAYMRIDYDGDGLAELRQIVKVGKTVLSNEEFDSVPIIGCTFIPMPHKHYGLSIYDLVGDLQFQKSHVLRQLFDNAYVANNGRMEVLDGMVNMSDLLTSRPNGVVRVKALGAIKRIDNPLIGAPFYNLLEYLDKVKVNRVGARDFGDAVDPNALNAKAHTAELVSNAAQERTNLMARIGAETAIKDIFWKILELTSKHQDKRIQIKLRGKWVQVDPREWKDRFNMTVTVGLGTGSQQAKLANARVVGEFAQGVMQAGLSGRVLTEENIYYLCHLVAKATFPKEADLLFTNPASLPPPQEKPDPEMIKLQLQKQKQDASNMLKQAKMEMDAANAERDRQLQAVMMRFDAVVGQLEQGRKHQAELEQTLVQARADTERAVIEAAANARAEAGKAASEQHAIVLQGVVDSFKTAQEHHQNKIESLLQGHIDVQVEKAKPKPKPPAKQ